MNTSTSRTASLDGALARVSRAGEHLGELVRQIEAVRQEQFDAIAWDFDADRPGEIKVVANEEIFVPLPGFGILVGEVAYNLRAALDYLIYELAILDSGNIVNGTQFPIEDKPKGFASRQKRGWLGGLNPAHIAAVESLQPYRGHNWTRALRDISNPDKHRNLVYSQGSYGLRVYPRADRLRFLDIPGKVSSAHHPVTGEEVHVKMDLSLEIQFSDGTPVVQTLEILKSNVADVLDGFKPAFE